MADDRARGDRDASEDWLKPDAATLRQAVGLAYDAQAATHEKVLVVAEVRGGTMGFNILLEGAYAALRERGRTSRYAIVATVDASGVSMADTLDGYDTRPF